MIALAYLYVLQGLLAPYAALAGPRHGPAGAMPLCEEMASAAAGTDPVAQQGSPVPDAHDHDLCCDLGCLPHASGLQGVALALPAVADLPSPAVSSPTAWTKERASQPGPRPPPGSPGPRAPPVLFT